MIYLTQLIYIHDGEQHTFDQFEDIAIPTISKYNGRLLLRVRPGNNSVIEGELDAPYEIHVVEFSSDQDFENFKSDPERQRFMHLKEKSIRSVMLIKGVQI